MILVYGSDLIEGKLFLTRVCCVLWYNDTEYTGKTRSLYKKYYNQNTQIYSLFSLTIVIIIVTHTACETCKCLVKCILNVWLLQALKLNIQLYKCNLIDINGSEYTTITQLQLTIAWYRSVQNSNTIISISNTHKFLTGDV